MPELAEPAWLAALAPLVLLMVLGLGRIRGPGRIRRAVSSALRLLAVAALLVALAGPLAGSYSRHADVIFALDVSSSVGSDARSRALAFINRAFAERSSGARMGLVVFAADAALEVFLDDSADPVTDVSAHVERGATDIGRAIEVAIGAFPSQDHRRVVLLSDGRENRGDARAAAAVARSIGVEISTVALEKSAARAEVYVEGIVAPQWVHENEPYRVQMTLHSNETASAHLIVLRDGAIVRDAVLELAKGTNVFSMVEQATSAGLHEYEVIVNSERDSELENNRYQAFVRVRGAPRVLHAVGDGNARGHIGDALKAQGIAVEEVSAAAIPSSMHRLSDYDLVVLDNVSGFDLSLSKMELLEDYVRDAGGGVVSLGGDRSYGAGGYYGTPIERLLPVTMDARSEVKIPSLAVVFVLDRSGSMASRTQGEEKLSIAKSAALSSIDLLNRLDRVGVLAFDSGVEWVVPPTEVGMRQPIVERLRMLESGGGTDLYGALEEAHRVMRGQRAKVKHLIVLSDGLTDSGGDFDALAARIAEDSITISTVAMGTDADRPLMRTLATLGKGRFYYTDDPRNVPRIFASETIVVARDLVVEATTQPTLTDASEVVKGFEPDDFPPLAGYQRTFAKPAAQVVLGTPTGDPLLVQWRYGLGKSVAFMSELAGRWGAQWVGWPELGRFVAQLARWTMRRTGNESLLPRFRWHGGRGEMVVDALDRDDRFINGLVLEAAITDPERTTTRTLLEQVSPGRYRAEFEVPRSGRYFVTLSGQVDGTRVGPQTFGLAVPYSSEYLELGTDRRLLADIAATTGGKTLPLASAALADINAPPPAEATERHRIWKPLLVTALVLLLLDVAVRKVALPEALRRRRAEPEATDDELGYEALRARIARVRERHLEALRAGASAGTDDAAARARLYLARRH